MKKIWIFKKNLLKQIKREGFSLFSAKELEGLLEFLLGRKLSDFNFEKLSARGIAAKEALIYCCIHEMGKRAAQKGSEDGLS